MIISCSIVFYAISYKNTHPDCLFRKSMPAACKPDVTASSAASRAVADSCRQACSLQLPRMRLSENQCLQTILAMSVNLIEAVGVDFRQLYTYGNYCFEICIKQFSQDDVYKISTYLSVIKLQQFHKYRYNIKS